jgi:dihydropteroate synthase-like protein
MRILFVTGKLAEPSLRRVLDGFAPGAGIDAEVVVLPISVAALMTPRWVAHHLERREGIDKVVLPGHCRGDLSSVESAVGAPVIAGPEDLRDLPGFFGGESADREGYGTYTIEIIAEINNAPRLSRDELIAAAEGYRASGADVIDIGCDPGARWLGVGAAVNELKDRGMRVSIDSFDPAEASDAVAAGAELVLSVNATNRAFAEEWGVEVVVIPDRAGTLEGLEESAEFLRARAIPFRIDPVLDPIGFGFAASLGRFIEVRRLFPDARMFMGIGNLTELTDADSAGVNTLLIGFCQELGITSVLTTEVINWARSSVKEIDIARRLMHHAVSRHTLPKRVDSRLVTLRDTKLSRFGVQALSEIAMRIKDPNWRIFAEEGNIIVMNGASFRLCNDAFELFDQMEVDDPSHAFYLGWEMQKAKTALTLHKNYRQDQALDWGYLTEPEGVHRDREKRAKREGDS